MKTNLLTTILLILIVLVIVPLGWYLFLGPQSQPPATETSIADFSTPSPVPQVFNTDALIRLLKTNSEINYQIPGQEKSRFRGW